jgi:ATP-dependent exoDNAse (exonuclease V) beta subunit
MTEGECVAVAIHRMVAAGECGYGDVMILLRAFTHLPLYLRPLRRRGIPFVVDGGRELLERTEVVQLLAVLRAFARPADPVALLGFLRSPAGGAADTELAGYAGSGRWDWREPVDPEAHPQIHRAFGVLRRVAAATRGDSTDVVLRRLVEEARLVPLAAFGYEGAQRVANLRKITMAAVELAREGRLTLNEILDALERERLADLEGESPLADETWGSVRVLTVHKAKGLQNRVVFLPDLAREPAVRQPEVEVRVVHPPGGATLAVQLGRRGNAAGLWRIAEEERHERAEEIRTLYVALTRAEERIVLVAGRSRRAAAWVEALRAWGYDPGAPPPDGATIDPGVVHRVVTPGATPPTARRPVPERDAEAVRRWDRALALLRIAPPPFARPSGQREADEARRESETTGLPAPRPRRARGRARAVGRAVHRALEIWESGRDQDLLGSVPALARDAATEEGIQPEEVELESREVLHAFLASPLASRIREVVVLGREVPTLHAGPSGTIWRGSIDLLFRDGDRIVIADYKTDPAERGALFRHGPQLRAYVEAVRRALDLAEPPRAELWMLRQGTILVLEEEPGQAQLF